MKLLDREMDAGRQRMANQSHQLAGQLFRWALRRGYVDQDPTAGVDKPAKDKSRDRVLSDKELAEVWQAASQLGYPFGPFVQLLILTSQRRNEVAGLLWAEIDFDKQLWSLPADRTKNGRPHDVPLSASAMAILEKTPRLADRVFPSAKKTSERPINGFSKTKRRVDALILDGRKRRAAALDHSSDDVEPMPAWVLHDLRRTTVTGMAELGAQPHVIEAVVNHVSGHKAGFAGVYNRATYAVEKREALERWSTHIASIVDVDADIVEAETSGTPDS
ncbi:MAG: site-specific integrase [Alphaproteobacteria bacterium]